MKGVDAWNEWRDENPDIRPDLAGAEVGWMNHTRPVLSGANLSRAVLWRARLDGEYLNDADLSDADLRIAHLIAELGEKVIRPAEDLLSSTKTGTASRPPRRRRRAAPTR
jgi:uncharacterized protein YjbI with pentapeptide repeats